MSKIVSFVIVGGLVILAIAAINISDVHAREQTEFIQISVLSEDQANYGVDENLSTIPAVSIEIVEDKMHDDGEALSSLPVITFTSKSPANDPKPASQDNDDPESVEQVKQHGNPGNGNNNGNGNGNGNNNGNGNANNNGNGGTNQNGGGNGNGNGNNGEDGNNGNSGGNEKETKPDKAK